MKKSYKLIALSVCLAFMFSQMQAFAQSNPTVETFPDVVGTKYQKAVDVLNSLEIMYGTEDGSFKPESSITRVEMVVTLIRAMGFQELTMPTGQTAENAYFADVPRDYWAAEDINLAYNLNWIKGNGTGYFRPDETITHAEAVKLMITALGYRYVAEDTGGYPTGYIACATDLGLLKGIAANDDAKFSRGDTALLIYNSLEVPIMELLPSVNGKPQYSSKAGHTILSKIQEITEEKGIVEANDQTFLLGEGKLSKGKVMINGEIFEVGDTNAKELLGYSVKYMFEVRDGLKILRHVEPYHTNVQVLDNDDNRNTYSNFKYTYYQQSSTGDKKTIYDVSKLAYRIFNGKSALGLSDDDMVPEDGEVILIDNDNDDEYDVVVINSYYNFIVSSYNSDNHTLYAKDGKHIVLDDDTQYTIADVDGEPWKMAQLVPGVVISVFESKGKALYRIVANSETMEGTIDEIAQDDDASVVVNEKSYTLSKDIYTQNNVELKVGMTGVFFLDMKGKVAAFTPDNSEVFFGYLTDSNKGKTISVQPMIKMYKTDGKFQTFRLTKRVEIDGDRIDADKIFEKLGDGENIPSQIVRYKINSNNEINFMDTANKGIDEGEGSLHLGADIVDGYYRTASKNLGSKINLQDNTIVFQIPSDLKDEQGFGSVKPSSFAVGVKYTAKAYATTSDYMANVLVMAGGTTSAAYNDASSVMSVAIKITQGINEEGENIHNLYVLTGGNAEVLKINNDSILDIIDSEHNGVVVGKIFRYALTGRGYVGNIQAIYNPHTKEFKPAGAFNNKFRVAMADIYHKEDNNLVLLPINAAGGGNVWGGPYQRNDLPNLTDGMLTSKEVYVGTMYKIITVDLKVKEADKAVVLRNMSNLSDYKSLRQSDLAIYQTRDSDPIALVAYK